MKKVLIVGLGLIGASYALKLKENGYYVYGYDKDIDTINYALKNDIIDEYIELKNALLVNDFIIVSIYPKDILNFLTQNIDYFKENTLITDTTGVKNCYFDQIKELLKDKKITYIPHHPMAGLEKLGIKNANINLFLNANFIMIEGINANSKDYEKINLLGKTLGFKNIIFTDYLKHDEMISFTSQLTHVLAICLMNSKNQDEILKFTGDSYRDLTRIADIDVNLWTELFLDNKNYLSKEIDNFILELQKINTTIKNNDYINLSNILLKGKLERKKMMQDGRTKS